MAERVIVEHHQRRRSDTDNVSAAEVAATCEFLAEMDAFLALEQPTLSPALVGSSSNISDKSQSMPAATKKKMKKSSTQRQKEELGYLRAKVGQLERELRDLKNVQRDGSEHAAVSGSKGDEEMTTAALLSRRAAVRRPASMWRAMAQRQLREKQRAELENAQLKEAIEGQLRLAKTLERMLHKRQVWEEEQLPTCSSRSKQEEVIFRHLTESLDARLHEAGAVFEENGPLAFVTDSLDEVSIVEGDSEDVCITFANVKTVPFDFRSTACVTWKHICLKNRTLKAITANSLIIKETEDTLVTKRLSTVLTADERRTATSHTEFRRFEREDYVLLVWESIIENAGEPSSEKPTIRVFLQGSCKISRAVAKDGSVASRILSYTRMSPKVLLDASAHVADQACDEIEKEKEEVVKLQTERIDRHHRAGVLTEMMIGFFKQNMQSVRQAIENDLMDDFFTHQRSQRCGLPT